MSIATEISRLKSAKSAIAAAIAGKGVTVPDGTLLDGMASLIESIEAGGGGGGTGYNFDGNPRWVSSGEFTVSETVSVSTIEPILFNPEVMDGEQSDWNRGRFFLLFDATKIKRSIDYSNPVGANVNGIAAIINYAYSYGIKYPNNEFTVYFYVGGSYLTVEREYGHSTYDQISFASTSRKFISGHRYCWVAWGMKAGNEA